VTLWERLKYFRPQLLASPATDLTAVLPIVGYLANEGEDLIVLDSLNEPRPTQCTEEEIAAYLPNVDGFGFPQAVILESLLPADGGYLLLWGGHHKAVIRSLAANDRS
jgi:hypothetical protein